jgi:hypothetical protein
MSKVRNLVKLFSPLSLRRLIRRKRIFDSQRSEASLANIIYRDITSCSSYSKKLGILNREGIRTELIVTSLLEHLFASIEGDRSLSLVTHHEIETGVSHDIDFVSLIIIYDLYKRCGLYYTGFNYRVVAQNRLLTWPSYKISQFNCSSQYLSTLLERQLVTSEFDFLKYVNEFQTESARLDTWSSFGQMWFNDGGIFKQDDYLNSEFQEYVRGKSIALVGPSPGALADGEEIESFDLILRLNYSYAGKGCDANTKGTRTDLSYFMREHGDAFLTEQGGTLPTDLKWAVMKDPEHKHKTVKSSEQRVRALEGIEERSMAFHASYTAVQCVLIDLLKYPVSRIKVFHCDLFLTVMRSPGYTPKTVNRESSWQQKRDVNKSFHDPYTNFLLLRSLFYNGRIEADDGLFKVLSLEPLNYLQMMEERYDEAKWRRSS